MAQARPNPLNGVASTNGLLPDGPSNRVDLIDSEHGRILCIADVRGRLGQINELAKEHGAKAVIHSGDFGFYEPSSLERISDRTLRHLIQYSSLITPQFRSQLLAPSTSLAQCRALLSRPPPGSSLAAFPLSEFPDLVSGKLRFSVPVYTVWGACEDVSVIERIRAAPPASISVPPNPLPPLPASSASLATTTAPQMTADNYSIHNLTVLDEATTRVLVLGGVRLRLFGLGGAVVPHKLFDNGEGGATIAGGQGTMWTTVLQIGEIVDTAQRVYDASETRLLVSHASPGREGLLAQLGLVLKADLSISAGLHFRYGVSYNEFSVQHDQETFRAKLNQAKSSFNEIYDTIKDQVRSVIDEQQTILLDNALAVTNRVPPPPAVGGQATGEESAWKNSWHWNLPDAAYGNLVLDVKDGRLGSEMRSQGFNFSYRAQNAAQQQPVAPRAGLGAPASQPPSRGTFQTPPASQPTPYRHQQHQPSLGNHVISGPQNQGPPVGPAGRGKPVGQPQTTPGKPSPFAAGPNSAGPPHHPHQHQHPHHQQPPHRASPSFGRDTPPVPPSSSGGGKFGPGPRADHQHRQQRSRDAPPPTSTLPPSSSAAAGAAPVTPSTDRVDATALNGTSTASPAQPPVPVPGGDVDGARKKAPIGPGSGPGGRKVKQQGGKGQGQAAQGQGQGGRSDAEKAGANDKTAPTTPAGPLPTTGAGGAGADEASGNESPVAGDQAGRGGRGGRGGGRGGRGGGERVFSRGGGRGGRGGGRGGGSMGGGPVGEGGSPTTTTTPVTAPTGGAGGGTTSPPPGAGSSTRGGSGGGGSGGGGRGRGFGQALAGAGISTKPASTPSAQAPASAPAPAPVPPPAPAPAPAAVPAAPAQTPTPAPAPAAASGDAK